MCIVTGGNSGIGYATCEGLAAAGATVIMASRDAERAGWSIDRIRKSTGTAVEFLPLDLASQTSIREFATTFRARFNHLHVLIHNFIGSYSQAELAKILWTYELSRRLAGSGVTANCLHPGGVRTELFRHFRGPMRWLLWLSDGLKKSPASGAKTSQYLAISREVENLSGEYFVGRRAVRSAAATHNEALAKRVWDLAEQLAGIHVQA